MSAGCIDQLFSKCCINSVICVTQMRLVEKQKQQCDSQCGFFSFQRTPTDDNLPRKKAYLQMYSLLDSEFCPVCDWSGKAAQQCFFFSSIPLLCFFLNLHFPSHTYSLSAYLQLHNYTPGNNYVCQCKTKALLAHKITCWLRNGLCSSSALL